MIIFINNISLHSMSSNDASWSLFCVREPESELSIGLEGNLLNFSLSMEEKKSTSSSILESDVTRYQKKRPFLRPVRHKTWNVCLLKTTVAQFRYNISQPSPLEGSQSEDLFWNFEVRTEYASCSIYGRFGRNLSLGSYLFFKFVLLHFSPLSYHLLPFSAKCITFA